MKRAEAVRVAAFLLLPARIRAVLRARRLRRARGFRRVAEAVTSGMSVAVLAGEVATLRARLDRQNALVEGVVGLLTAEHDLRREDREEVEALLAGMKAGQK